MSMVQKEANRQSTDRGLFELWRRTRVCRRMTALNSSQEEKERAKERNSEERSSTDVPYITGHPAGISRSGQVAPSPTAVTSSACSRGRVGYLCCRCVRVCVRVRGVCFSSLTAVTRVQLIEELDEQFVRKRFRKYGFGLKQTPRQSETIYFFT